MTKTYININGVSKDASTLDMSQADRYFRNAWDFNGDVIDIDMVKARDIQRDKLRADREARLVELDRIQQTALTSGNAAIGNGQADKVNLPSGSYNATQIEAQKQKFRDVTVDQRIEDATTPEALKLLTLDALATV